MTSKLGQERLKADGRNRALRVFINGFVVSALGAAGIFFTDQLADFDLTSGDGLRSAGQALLQTVLMAGAAYLMRTKLDPSSVPTPLPPEDPGPPAADVTPTPPITAVEESPEEPEPVPDLYSIDDTREIPRVPQPGTRAYARWIETRGREQRKP